MTADTDNRAAPAGELCQHGIPDGVGCLVCDTDGAAEALGVTPPAAAVSRGDLAHKAGSLFSRFCALADDVPVGIGSTLTVGDVRRAVRERHYARRGGLLLGGIEIDHEKREVRYLTPEQAAVRPAGEASDTPGDGTLWEGVFLAVPVRIVGVIGHNVLGAEVQIKSYEGMPWSTARDALCGGLKMKHFTAHLACLLRDSLAREAETKRALGDAIDRLERADALQLETLTAQAQERERAEKAETRLATVATAYREWIGWSAGIASDEQFIAEVDDILGDKPATATGDKEPTK